VLFNGKASSSAGSEVLGLLDYSLE
jgi:hypothetical protein